MLNFNLFISGDDIVSFTQYIVVKPRQIRKEAAVDYLYMCRETLINSWLYLGFSEQGIQPTVHGYLVKK